MIIGRRCQGMEHGISQAPEPSQGSDPFYFPGSDPFYFPVYCKRVLRQLKFTDEEIEGLLE